MLRPQRVHRSARNSVATRSLRRKGWAVSFGDPAKHEQSMVCLWDNAATMHLGPNDYDGFRREMYRTTTAGGVPV
ncbi:hypothetical protein [Aurantiacibacter luteus]|uniref:TauD/TfdA-like domain-containing protein n=1 Tax=Aurantiacibacter luteus TaxID=1581420 RepID=A0A0G9MXV3_9SPHN|nr:hypothetical protein [Aurantiacibacter luteus]KLE34103.1 hypothetical protein AAW00_07395 [Aurantiacibacter luteus]